MESSRFGRPNMDAMLEEDSFKGGGSRSWSSCDYEGLMADEAVEDDSSPLSANDVPAGNPMLSALCDDVGDFSGYPDDGGELSLSRNDDLVPDVSDNCNLFVPDLVYNLDKEDDRPGMPDLPIAKFPAGTSVWVVDLSHVMVQLGDAWDHNVREVCNGQCMGTVVRHNTPDLLFVRFPPATADGIDRCYTIPRRCLSIARIEAYPLPEEGGLEGAVSFGVGGLKPRAGRAKAKTSEDVRVLQQYCEIVDAATPCHAASAAWDLFLKRKFQDCIEALNQLLSEGPTAVGPATSSSSDVVNEILTWRSFAHFFNREYEKSLADALRTIENNTSWVRGYVRAARAYTGLGKIPRAIEMMTQADLLLPGSTEVRDTLDMLHYLKRVQAKVDAHSLQYSLDPNYARRLMTRRAFARGDTIFEDDAILVGCPSVENQGECCEVCLCPTDRTVVVAGMVSGRSSNSSGGADGPSRPMRLCSSRCEAVGRNFLSVEAGVGAKGCDFAVQLLLNKASNSADVLSIERARLAMRLFYMAYYRHQRQLEGGDGRSGSGRKVSVRDVLAAVGVFPIPSIEMENKVRDDVEALHTVISAFIPPEDHGTYGKDLFVMAFNYVAHYAVRVVGTDAGGKPIAGYVVASTASCVERSDKVGGPAAGDASSSSVVNCEVRLVGPSRVALVATTAIESGARLTIEALRKGRYQ